MVQVVDCRLVCKVQGAGSREMSFDFEDVSLRYDTGTVTGNNDEKRKLASESWKIGTAAVLCSGTCAIVRG
jgi:hypothetical protein